MSRPPCGCRLGQTNSPDNRKKNDIRKTSCQAQNRSKPINRAVSTIGKAAPQIGRLVERKGLRRQKVQIGQHRMKRQHQQDDEGAQIVDRQAGARRAGAPWRAQAGCHAEHPAFRVRACREPARAARSGRCCGRVPMRCDRPGRSRHRLFGLGRRAASARHAPRSRGGPIRPAGTAPPPPSCRAAPAPSARPCWTCRDGSTATGCRRPSPWSSR